MCGLFGALERLPSDTLDAAAHAIHHRGPDSDGRYVDDRVSLLHARLKIIDLSDAAAQPMASDDGSARLVFNGEIYNHVELRRQLESRATFRSRSDTEVILHGYEVWGDSVVERLDGMFAFAIWDSRADRLLLARDRAGKKPLFYTSRDGVFRFGSTIRSLLAAGVPARFATNTLSCYLAQGYLPETQTAYEGISQLGPGETLVVEHGHPKDAQRYWTPTFGVDLVKDDYATATRKTRTLVEAAVERRLESDVPLGAFLSGGIDSSIIVGIMARRLTRLSTFSIGFSGDSRYDETDYARTAARAFGTHHTEFTLQPSSFDLIETLVQHYEGPFGDSSAIPTYVVSKMTREHVTVALTGDGGDEIFCGYQRFVAAEWSEHIPAPLRVALGYAANGLPASRERSLLSKAKRFFSGLDSELLARIDRWTPFFADPMSILRPELCASAASALPLSLSEPRSSDRRPVLHRVLDANFRTYLPGDLLVKADRCSMAHALELRSPFLDTALIEYASRLPSSYLRRGATLKRILKDAFVDLLPSRIRRRGKMGFGVPLGTWFRGELRGYLHDWLGASARVNHYLKRPAIERMLVEHEAGVADHGQRIWALLTLEIWLSGL